MLIKLRNLILGGNVENSDWINVPRDIASIYMLYLANHIAQKNELSLSTDYTEAWCGSNFFQYDGNIDDSEYNGYTNEALAAITIGRFAPKGIMNITPIKLIEFRESSNQERKRFFQSIRDLSTKISSCKDTKVIGDIVDDYITELEDSKKDYVKRMKDIKIEHFFGVKTVMVPVLLDVIAAFTSLPDYLICRLKAIGVGIGIIGGFWDSKLTVSRERKNYECNYLMQLSECVSRSYRANFMNIHAGYQQYINDNLNHFLRD